MGPPLCFNDNFDILWTSYYSPLMTYENGIEVNIICQMSNSLTFIYALLHEAGISISFFFAKKFGVNHKVTLTPSAKDLPRGPQYIPLSFHYR